MLTRVQGVKGNLLLLCVPPGFNHTPLRSSPGKVQLAQANGTAPIKANLFAFSM
jgi:hypothetical protein